MRQFTYAVRLTPTEPTAAMLLTLPAIGAGIRIGTQRMILERGSWFYSLNRPSTRRR